MSRQLVGPVIVVTLSLAVSLANGQSRRGGGERSGGERSEGGRSEGGRFGGERSGNQSARNRKPPGGAWSEYKPAGEQSGGRFGNSRNASGAEGAAAGAARSNRNSPQASGAEGAAAGAARSNRNSPQASGAAGAAAGAATANRNAPNASGAQGAAAGAAAANRNNPQYSGAQGAAAGAAAANRNQPQYSGAEGAAAGAAAANRNSPQYSGAEGAAAGVAVANYNEPAASGAAGAAAGYAAVRDNVNHDPGMYGQQWYGEHEAAWAPDGWSASTPWTPSTWAAIAANCGYGNSPAVSYNYGDNVTCVGGNVVIDGQPAGTAEDFSHEADIIAEDGAAAQTSPTDQWLPLGVFALVRNEQQHPQLIMQLAVNQQGLIRGNYTDEVTNTTLPVHGGVDPKTKRAAWTIGDNRYAVMEAGMQNLTQSEAPALLHKNGTTQRWLLVRLAQGGQRGDATPPAVTPQ
jgi:hypothetical protein